MKITLIQALLIRIGSPTWVNRYTMAITAGKYLGCIQTAGQLYGTLVGFILGDPVQGCIIGAAIDLPYVAFISAGGTAPQDPGLAGTVGTAWAMAAGVNPAAAVTIALPLGLLGTMVWVAHMTLGRNLCTYG